MSQHARHRISPPMRAHRPTPRGRHRIADRPQRTVGYMRTVVAAFIVALVAVVHLPVGAGPRRVRL